MSQLDPTESPRAQGLLDVGDGQRVYWEEWGRGDGVPALYLHGGPGSGLGTSAYRGRFDLSRTRLVAFEQRGCGRSTPHASEPSMLVDEGAGHGGASMGELWRRANDDLLDRLEQ